MFIATLQNNAITFYLRGTTWAFSANRADQFETEEGVKAAIEKAAKFMKKSMVKKIVISKV
jgi:hypothetical protein